MSLASDLDWAKRELLDLQRSERGLTVEVTANCGVKPYFVATIYDYFDGGFDSIYQQRLMILTTMLGERIIESEIVLGNLCTWSIPLPNEHFSMSSPISTWFYFLCNVDPDPFFFLDAPGGIMHSTFHADTPIETLAEEYCSASISEPVEKTISVVSILEAAIRLKSKGSEFQFFAPDCLEHSLGRLYIMGDEVDSFETLSRRVGTSSEKRAAASDHSDGTKDSKFFILSSGEIRKRYSISGKQVRDWASSEEHSCLEQTPGKVRKYKVYPNDPELIALSKGISSTKLH